MSETHWITPMLMLGQVPAGIGRAVRVSSPTQAVQAIGRGQVAVLPAGDWTGARNVMQWLGMTSSEIEDRIVFATTGYPPR